MIRGRWGEARGQIGWGEVTRLERHDGEVVVLVARRGDQRLQLLLPRLVEAQRLSKLKLRAIHTCSIDKNWVKERRESRIEGIQFTALHFVFHCRIEAIQKSQPTFDCCVQPLDRCQTDGTGQFIGV